MDKEIEIPSKEADSTVMSMVEIMVGILKGLTDDPLYADLV
jgi:hypothetical protein